jgi:DNA adenine methylase
MPEHRIYVEPFGGGASVLMLKPRSYAEVYNDLDSEVVNVFRVLRQPAKAARLTKLLEHTPFSRKEFNAAYMKSRGPIEQARRTIVKSYMGFASNSIHNKNPRGMRTAASTWKAPTGFRSNSNRSGTTPAHDWWNYPSHIDSFAERLRGVVVENRDALEVMASHDSGETLHYVDPPYVLSTRDRGIDYKHEFTDHQHIRLAKFLGELKGMVIVSAYWSDLYAKHYVGWQSFQRRSMTGSRRQAIETLLLNQRAYQRLPRKLFDAEVTA